MKSNLTGAMIASAVATLFSAGCATSSTQAAAMDGHDKQGAAMSGGVMCKGINSCKGSGSCKGDSNSCGSQNSCKGQGLTSVDSAKTCSDKGGTVLASK
jgi:uncharacterized membrane protein